MIDSDPPFFRVAGQRLAEKSLTEVQVEKLWTWRSTLMGRVSAALSIMRAERLTLEKRLPKSLVAVTAAVGAARRLQTAWSTIESKHARLAAVEACKYIEPGGRILVGCRQVQFPDGSLGALHRWRLNDNLPVSAKDNDVANALDYSRYARSPKDWPDR